MEPSMDAVLLEPQAWARTHFGEAPLGDRRRTERLVKLAAQVAGDPSGSFPEQTETWADLKAAYRLFDCPEVTFAAVLAPHWQQTRVRPPGRYLIIDDTTEIDYPQRRQIADVGPTGNGSHHGFLLHSGLLVAADSEAILGLAGQKIHYRQPAPKGETRTQRLNRPRESEVWGMVIDAIGPPPAQTQWIHVMDRGADDFETLCHCQQQRVDWIVRAKSLHRKMRAPHSLETSVQEYLPTLPVAGTFELKLRARPKQPARTATLEVRHGPATLLPPQLQSPYLKSLSPSPLPQTVVWVRELYPPPGAEPIEWILYTSLPVTSREDALQVIRYYEKRWLIEEWHKALKTGCQVTKRQLMTAARLEAMVGLMSVEAVRLLQLKAIARTDPERPAEQVIPRRYVAALQILRKRRTSDLWTIRRFFRELAGLGGFLGRTGDGEPGWITIWRGWEKMHLLLRGVDLARQADW
jgi:hypothetical protein